MTDRAVGWPEWLVLALDDRDWKPADLARASGQKPNGRPVIAPDVISGWLNSGAKPDPKFWPVLAGIFDVPVEDLALLVSGAVAPRREAAPLNDARSAIAADRRLSAEARAMLLASYDALAQEFGPATAQQRERLQQERRGSGGTVAKPGREAR